MSTSVVYVGMDVHKDSITIAVAREGREAAENWKTIPYDGVRLRKALKMLRQKRRSLEGLLRGGAHGIRSVPASARSGDRLHRRRSFAGAGQAGRPGEDRPPRRPQAGALPPLRRSDGGVCAGRGRGSDPRPGASPGRCQVCRAGGAASVEQVPLASRSALGRNRPGRGSIAIGSARRSSPIRLSSGCWRIT